VAVSPRFVDSIPEPVHEIDCSKLHARARRAPIAA
jgi:hypothetical protein